MRTLPLVTAAALACLPDASAGLRLRGVLQEKGTKNRLAGINVFVLPSKLKATTDPTGHFVFDDVPTGEISWIVNAVGYRRLEQKDYAEAESQDRERVLILEREDYQVYETTVVGQLDKRDTTSRGLKPSEIKQIPGSGNDPIKAIQNLPGVNRPSPFQSQVIIQGSAPQDTRYQIDGHTVPLIFHFGGLTSVIPPETIDRVEYLSAGYGPENGRALGGLVTAWTRDGRTDRLHGFGFLDSFNAGALLEGKAGEDGSFFLGARKSYIGQVLKATLPEDSDFDLTVAPGYEDATGLYQKKLSPKDDFRLLAVGSRDELKFLFEEPLDADPSLRGTFRNNTSFFRFIPQLTHRFDERTTSRWSLGFGRDAIRVDLADNFFYLSSWELSARGEVERKMNRLWTAQWGLDHRSYRANVDLLIREFFIEGGIANPFSAGEFQKVRVTQSYHSPAVYWRNQIRLGENSPWTVLPSLRAEYYSSTGETFALPRLGLRYRWSDSLSFAANGGLYAQPPLEQETDPTVGNPDIHAPTAWHLALSGEKDLRGGSTRGWIVSSGLFYRYFDDLVIPDLEDNYSNDGRGRAFGAEALIRYELKPWSGWISYTLSRSERWSPGRSWYPFDYDQTHLLTALAGYELPRNWRIGARLRYATGNPVTPVVGSWFDADHDVYYPERGAFYSERLEPFFQLDLRIDKKWVYNTWILSAYLDVQNVTNRKNLEQIQYSYDYSTRTKVQGLPILPTIGVQAEF